MPELNPHQKTAVHYINSSLLILAGAGSGKTSVITHKIAWLIREFGVEPHHITAVTFNNRAAREMKTRVADLLNSQNTKGVTIFTFHALGLNILQNSLREVGYSSSFSIYDAEDSQALVAKLLRADHPDAADNLAQEVQKQISYWKKTLVKPEQSSIGNESIQDIAISIYSKYEQRLLAYNAMDFDDLILKPVRLFQDFPNTLTNWRKRIHYLLVDDYQDANACQHELVKLLTGKRGVLTVAADDDQSICAAWGAQPENLKYLQQDFPDLKVVKLEQNYRSTGRILRAANALIANNSHVFEKALWGDRTYGDPVHVLKTRSEEHEAERVVSELVYHKFKHGTDFRDYAILFRNHSQVRLLERVLRERRIPYFLSGATSFFDKTEIKDIMAYLRLLCNPDDDNAFLRVINTPRREVSPETLEQLSRHASELGASLLRASLDTGLEHYLLAKQAAGLRVFTQWLANTVEQASKEDPIKVVCDMLADLHYEDWLKDTCNDQKIAEQKMKNILDLVAWLQRLAAQQDGEKTLSRLVASLSLIGLLEKNSEDNPGDYVSLMTLHSTKGQEFPHVFIIGMEEDLLPYQASLGEKGVEEERRLAYVGMTRARETLTFSLAERRKHGGEIVVCKPSRFLSELPQDDLEWIDQEGRDHLNDILGRGEAYLANLRAMLDNNN